MWIALAGVAINLAVVLIGGTYALGNSREAIFKEIRDGLSAETKLFGETIAAVRQRINDVELEGFKTFVRRESFYEITRQMKESADARFDKLESKLDRILEVRSIAEKK